MKKLVSRLSNDETFFEGSKQVTRVVQETRKYYNSPNNNTNSFDALALEDALQIEKREAGVFAHLLMKMEVGKLSAAPRVRGAILVGPRGSGKGQAIDEGLKECSWDPVLDSIWTRRSTFSNFMEDSIDRLLMFRKDRTLPLRDPIPYLVQQLVKTRLLGGDGLRLLILEDVVVSSMVDAMLLRRLFKGLFGFGVGVILTTPRPPSTWYSYGVDRQKLSPFIDLLQMNCEVVRLDTPFKSLHRVD